MLSYHAQHDEGGAVGDGDYRVLGSAIHFMRKQLQMPALPQWSLDLAQMRETQPGRSTLWQLPVARRRRSFVSESLSLPLLRRIHRLESAEKGIVASAVYQDRECGFVDDRNPQSDGFIALRSTRLAAQQVAGLR